MRGTDPIIDRLVNNDYIPENWGYFIKKGFIHFYKNIVPILKTSKETTYPIGSKDIFKVFKLTNLDDLKVVIIGQDPYHDGSATGIAFDNWKTRKGISPSLINVLAEIRSDVGTTLADRNEVSYLEHLPPQGVLLLNAALTVEVGSPLSHFEMWKDFTEEVMKSLATKDNIVWLLWGKFAQGYEPLIVNPTHKIIKLSHPVPMAAKISFLGSKCFSLTNQYLKKMGHKPVKW